jgi:hypothetical protein
MGVPFFIHTIPNSSHIQGSSAVSSYSGVMLIHIVMFKDEERPTPQARLISPGTPRRQHVHARDLSVGLSEDDNYTSEQGDAVFIIPQAVHMYSPSEYSGAAQGLCKS